MCLCSLSLISAIYVQAKVECIMHTKRGGGERKRNRRVQVKPKLYHLSHQVRVRNKNGNKAICQALVLKMVSGGNVVSYSLCVGI